jgi:hypothetical protein
VGVEAGEEKGGQEDGRGRGREGENEEERGGTRRNKEERGGTRRNEEERIGTKRKEEGGGRRARKIPRKTYKLYDSLYGPLADGTRTSDELQLVHAVLAEGMATRNKASVARIGLRSRESAPVLPVLSVLPILPVVLVLLVLFVLLVLLVLSVLLVLLVSLSFPPSPSPCSHDKYNKIPREQQAR